MSDGSIVLRWTPEGGNPRRVRLEPRSVAGWDRIEEERRDGTWAVVGHERVADLELEAPAAVISDRVGAIHTFRGP